jgi:putative intracellular protease/amidase
LAIHSAAAFKGRKATSYPALRSKVDDLYDYQEQAVVVDGQLITSRGPATAMAFALAIVEHLVGNPISSKVASDLLFQ